MLFGSVTAASRCRDYILTAKGDKQADVRPSSILLYLIEALPHPGPNCHDQATDVLYAVVYPQNAAVLAAAFWRLSGTGLSSRQAEDCLRKQVDLRPMPFDLFRTRPSPIALHPVYDALRSRIAGLVERTVPTLPRPNNVTNSDVFLYPSGMSSIYHVHQLLLKWRAGETAILGFSYELTIKMMETYGPGLHFYSLGTDADLDQLASHLEQIPPEGRKVQAIWCECPSNPLLRTVNFRRVRQLANKHNLVVVVDETIGSFANVDVLDVADIVISSLTKSFNGYGDVLAGR
jgi:Cystathionine beta-lyases/cystathionine gamma-synthases